MVIQLPIKICPTEAWGGYKRNQKDRYAHIVCKSFTKDIERRNLNLRTPLKRLYQRMICFPEDETIHDNVLGMYIERFHDHSGCFNVPPPGPTKSI